MRLTLALIMLANILGGFFMIYATGLAVNILFTSGHWLSHIGIPFIWGSYNPTALMVLISVTIYTIFFKKFWPKNIFMFMFIWGISDVAFNAVYDLYHLPQLLTNPQPWQIGPTYPEIMGVEFTIGLIGLLILRPKFDFSWTKMKIIMAAIALICYAYSFATGYQVPSNPIYAHDVILNGLGFVEAISIQMFVYLVTGQQKPKENIFD